MRLGGKAGLTMIGIAITETAFEAISATLPLGSVGCENGPSEHGERLLWLEVRSRSLVASGS